MRTIDKNSFSGKIIQALKNNVEIIFSLNYRNSMRILNEKLVNMISGQENSPENAYQYIFKLRKQKIVEVQKNGNKLQIVLTEKGKKINLKFNYDKIELKEHKVWDGQFRMVIFDIPEKHRKARDSFRLKMSELGCVLLNNSVWIYPYPCQKEIDFIANYWKVGKYVHFVLVKDITGKEKLIKHFKL